MDNLRIWLMVLGLIIIVVIYFTGVGFDHHKSTRNLLKKRRKNHREPVLDTPVIKPKEEEIDYTDVFRRDGGLLHDKGGAGSSVSSDPQVDRKTGVVVFYITAPEGFSFNGAMLRDALYTAGMTFGSQQVFHHFGVGQSVSKQSIFSAANVREPGIFDLNRMEELSTDGLVLFMQLPAPINASVAFEHMLSTAQRLAEILKGHVRDERREHLSPEAIELIRNYVAGFNV